MKILEKDSDGFVLVYIDPNCGAEGCGDTN
jgi:hypothetical protein